MVENFFQIPTCKTHCGSFCPSELSPRSFTSDVNVFYFCVSFYAAPFFALSGKSFPHPFILQVECLHYHRTSKILLCAGVPCSWSLIGVLIPCILCSMSDENNGKAGESCVVFFFSLTECGVSGEGITFRSYLFPHNKQKKKRSAILAVWEIWPNCKGLFCFLMQTYSTTPLEIHGDAFTFSKLSSLSELLVTFLTPH